MLLGQEMGDLDNYQQRVDSSMVDCCRRVFNRWINNNGYPPEYPLSWAGLEKLLNNVQHGGAADSLKKALSSKGIAITKD